MRLRFSIGGITPALRGGVMSVYLLLACGCAASAAAQPAAPPAPKPATPSTPQSPTDPNARPGETETEPAPAPTGTEQAPAGAPAAEPAPSEPAESEVEPAPEPVPPGVEPSAPAPALPGSDVPTPEEMEQKLTEGLPPAPPASNEWTAPAPVFTLHGYLRMRGELMDTFWLGRRELSAFLADPMTSLPEAQREARRTGQGEDPFSRFRPLERREAAGVARVRCVDEDTNSDGTCDVSTLQFANIRLRLSPQLNLSEDVRVKMTFDVFDNLVAGQVPGSYYGTGPGSETAFASTDLPPNDNDDFGDSIRARRAWAEVRNRDLGELRFGRMPMHWGLGMYYNAGDGLDDDQSTDLDRALGITKIAGLYLSASYDFIAEGVAAPSFDNRPIDQSQLDDVDQFTFSVARRHTDEELSSAIERGELVLNAGVQLSIRNQDALYSPPTPINALPLAELEATTYTTDLWGLLRYRGLRLEAEVAWVTGGMDDVVISDVSEDEGKILSGTGDTDIDQLGYAFEAELRLLDEKLGIYLDQGLATGDSDVESLSSEADFITQLGTAHNNTISTFRFHPSYRIDLILWRNIMGQVTGAYYVRPGISYDFVRNDFGQLLGARLDFIWSRATAPVQTWGNDADLGIEIDVSLYFRTEDGPDLDDGYHAMLQYGVLFPMRGLAYRHEDTDLDTAQTLRLLLGVVY